MSDFPPTPVLTRHARERCAEMGISTMVAKRILQNPHLTRPGSRDFPERRIALSAAEPGYYVVFVPGDETEPDRIITVGFNDQRFVARAGATYERAE